MDAETVDLKDVTQTAELVAKIVAWLAALLGAVWAAGRWFWPEWQIYMANRLLIDSFRRNFGTKAADKIHELLRTHTRRQDQQDMRTAIVECALGVGTYVCDARSGDCILANDVIAELWGVPKDTLKGVGWLQCVEDKPRALAEWKFAFEHKMPYRGTYDIVNARTGERIKIITEAFPMGYGQDLEYYSGWVRRAAGHGETPRIA